MNRQSANKSLSWAREQVLHYCFFGLAVRTFYFVFVSILYFTVSSTFVGVYLFPVFLFLSKPLIFDNVTLCVDAVVSYVSLFLPYNGN